MVLKHGLRGVDPIHLSSVLILRSAGAGEVAFSSFDERLNAAAASERFSVLSPP